MNDRQDTEERGITPKMVASGVLLIAVVAFILDNTDRVTVGYIFGDTEVRLIVVLLVVLVVGMFVGYVGGRRAGR
jgi:uncharacterized integral membrane protein